MTTDALQILSKENEDLREKLAQAIENLAKASIQLREASENQQKEIEGFKDKVGRKAMLMAKEHGWCHDVQEALCELDIPIPDMTETVEITVRFELNATPGVALENIDKDYIASCVDYVEIVLDEDWSDVAQVSYDVVDARVVPKV